MVPEEEYGAKPEPINSACDAASSTGATNNSNQASYINRNKLSSAPNTLQSNSEPFSSPSLQTLVLASKEQAALQKRPNRYAHPSSTLPKSN